MLDEQAEERSFPDWRMSFLRVTPSDLGLEGHKEFLRDPAVAE